MKNMVDISAEAIIAIVSVAGIIITLYFNIRAQNSVSRGQFAALLNGLIQEHSNFLEKEDGLKTVQSCFNHAISYFDLLNRIAYLCLEKKISSDIGDYFEKYFEYVQLMMSWYDDTVSWDTKTPTAVRWSKIIDWCTRPNHIIVADTDMYFLPDKMVKIWQEFDKYDFKNRFSKYFEIKKIKEKERTEEQTAEFQTLKNNIGEMTNDIANKVNEKNGV